MRLSPNHPPVLVVATAMLGDKIGVRTDPLQLARLLETKVIQIAVIDGADPGGVTEATSWVGGGCFEVVHVSPRFGTHTNWCRAEIIKERLAAPAEPRSLSLARERARSAAA